MIERFDHLALSHGVLDSDIVNSGLVVAVPSLPSWCILKAASYSIQEQLTYVAIHATSKEARQDTYFMGPMADE